MLERVPIHNEPQAPRRSAFRPRRKAAWLRAADEGDRAPQRRWARIAGLAVVGLTLLLGIVRLAVAVIGGGSCEFVLRAVHAEGVERGATVEYGGMMVGKVVDRTARRGSIEFKVEISGEAEPDLVRQDAKWGFSGAYVIGGARHIVLEDPGNGPPAKRGQAWDLEPVPRVLRWWQEILGVLLVVLTLYLTIRYRGVLGGLLGGLLGRAVGRGP